MARKLLEHPIVPILVGALVVWDVPGDIKVRSYTLLFLLAWLAWDIWAFLTKSENKWYTRNRNVLFCCTVGLSAICVMEAMKWLLYLKLEEQQKDVASHLSIQLSMPPGRQVLHSSVTVVNGGGTAISNHRITCYVRRLVFYPSGGIDGVGMQEVLPEKTELRPYGDAETSYCFGSNTKQLVWPICADVTVMVVYSLVTQPEIQANKPFRYVARGDDFVWRQQPVDFAGNYCPPLTIPPGLGIPGQVTQLPAP
jgi:hypothetical protein